MRQLSKIFPCMYVGDMHFHNRCFNSSNSIANSYGSMCITTGIQNDTIMIKPNSLQFIDKFAFYIALIIVECYLWIGSFQFFKKIIKRLIAVNTGFSFAKKI